MTKTFCDVCEKEIIPGVTNSFMLNVYKFNPHPTGHVVPLGPTFCKTICETCFTILSDSAKSLKIDTNVD